MVTLNPEALLDRLVAEPNETEWLEFKISYFDPDRIGEYVSALANGAMLADRDRGFLVYGVENGTRKKVGTSIRLKAVKKGAENFENWINNQIDPSVSLELVDFVQNGLSFSILCIEATFDRPVKFKGVEYIRVGENTRKLSDFPNKERALWLATGRRKFEHAIAMSNQTVTEIVNLLEIKVYFELCSTPLPQIDEVIRKFVSINLLIDNLQGTYDITNLAALLFAKDLSFFPSIAYKSVRIIRYVGDDKQNSDLEQEGKRGYAVGFSGIIKFILDKIPKQEEYKDGVRRVVYLYPETAIREIVANALIHQDFTISGAGPIVEIYSNRLEVSNPGNSLITIDRILDDRRSRNEKLAEIMRELGLCEERGGGLDKAIISIEKSKLPAPDFIGSEHSFRVIMFGPKSFKEMSKLDKQRACFFHCIIHYLKQDFMSNSSLRERFSLMDEDYQLASAVITDTVKAGRIIPADPNQGNKFAKYIPYWAASVNTTPT